MIEILETGQRGNMMVYVTVDEVETVNRLFRQKDESAIYYNHGKKIAYHWNFPPEIVKKLKLNGKLVKCNRQ